jgi:hypothetical protein
MDDPPSDESRKTWLYVAAVAFAVLAAFAAFLRPDGAWPLVVMAAAFAVAANVDKIANLSASAMGVKFEIFTKRTEAAVDRMEDIAAGTGRIERSMERLAGHITGGESYPLVRVVPSKNGPLVLVVECKGDFALRGLSMRLVDASAADPRAEPGISAEIPFIAPRTLKVLSATFDSVRQSDNGRLIFFFDAFNGVMYQFLDYRKVDEQWRFASCVLAHGRAFKHMDDPAFGSQPNWETERVRLNIELEHEPTGKIS